jgi:uncharacterized protein
MEGPTSEAGTHGRPPNRQPPSIRRNASPLSGAVALLLLVPAACASAQDAHGAPAPGASDGRMTAPEFTPPPGTPVRWYEPGAAQDHPDAPVLVVRGQGEVEVDPDRARVSFAVETEAGSAREAADQNARQMTRVLDAVRAAGRELPGFRVETQGYSLNPRYQTPRDTGVSEIAGYTARNHVVVTVDRVGEVGRIMDAALQNGANRMAGLQFMVRDPEPHREAALREAVRKARAEARVMAEALGMRLGPPVHVEGGAELPMPRPMGDMVAFSRMEAAVSVPTPVEAGIQTVTAYVTIRFRLEPPR